MRQREGTWPVPQKHITQSLTPLSLPSRALQEILHRRVRQLTPLQHVGSAERGNRGQEVGLVHVFQADARWRRVIDLGTMESLWSVGEGLSAGTPAVVTLALSISHTIQSLLAPL